MFTLKAPEPYQNTEDQNRSPNYALQYITLLVAYIDVFVCRELILSTQRFKPVDRGLTYNGPQVV
jgi:hypothetical protein